MKLNCWEFKKCGMEFGGENSNDLGVCPAATAVALDGAHDGICGSRACWIIEGTLCDGQVQGAFDQKYRNCGKCDFYNAVRKEEGEGFIPTVVLLEQIEKESIEGA